MSPPLTLMYFRSNFCRVHSCWESTFGKGLVGHISSCHYHLPCRREELEWVEYPWWRQSMLMPRAKKRRCGISWPTFDSTAADWAQPSTLLWYQPPGQSRRWIWQHLIAHEIGPSAQSIHCGRTHSIPQMISVYFWCFAAEVNDWWFLIITLFLYKSYLLTECVICSSYLLLFHFL